MNARFAVALVLAALLPRLALATPPITEFRTSEARDTIVGPDSLPLPQRAAWLSAHNTLVPVGIGTAMCVVGSAGAWGGGNDFGAVGGGLAVIGVTLATVGLVVGPSAGYYYGGIGHRGSMGTLTRLGLLVAPSVVLVNQPSVRYSDEAGLAIVAGALMGVGLVTIEAIYDIAAVEGSVRRHNATLAPRTSWRLEPCVTPAAHAPGLALRARFGGSEGS